MATDVNYLAGQSSLWVQPDGPNTEPRYLGCHAIGDIPEPKGDSTLLYCPDPAQVGKFKVKNSFKGAPGVITTTLDTDLRKTADYLEDLADLGAKFTLFVNKVVSGRRDVFTNWDRSFVLRNTDITSTTLGKLAARTAADEGESTQSFALSVEEVVRCFKMEVTRLAVLETEPLNAISILGESRLEGGGLRAMQPNDLMFISSDALVGSAANVANVLKSEYESNFLATAANPFAAGLNAKGCVGFSIGTNSYRIMVARGTTVAASPAAIGYSDDKGVTWHVIPVGTVNGEFMSSPNSLFALDRYHIWFGSNSGRIYFSADGGLTWTLQEAAVISATVIVGINFYDETIGYAAYAGGQVAGSRDGATWSALTVSGSSALLDVCTISEFFAWVVGTDGMYYTMDGGTTWIKRSSDNVAAIDFANSTFGIAVGAAASGLVWMTNDGGYDWIPLPAITNAGFLNVEVLSSKLAYIVGKVSGGTGFVGKVMPA